VRFQGTGRNAARSGLNEMLIRDWDWDSELTLGRGGIADCHPVLSIF
jgi:hypothetical protein